MKFLLVCSVPESILNFRKDLILDLQARKIEIHVAAPNLQSNELLQKEFKNLNVNVHEIRLSRTGINPIADLCFLVDLWNLLKVLKPKFMLSYTIKPVIYSGFISFFSKSTDYFALITGLGYSFEKKSFMRYLLRTLVVNMYKLSIISTKKVFFQNPDDLQVFLDKKILKNDEKSVIVNGSGVNLNFFQKVSLPKNLTFLMIARLLESKGVREYVEAASILKIKYPYVNFDLVGSLDENRDSINKSELEEWIDSGKINYLGQLDDVRPAIQKSSVFVLPSYREGTPRSVLEAMSMGRAIITTDAPGCRETVIEGKNGFLVKVKSIDNLIDAMTKFIENAEIIEQCGNISRDLAEKKFDVKNVNSKMIKEMEIT
mgnify:CR=1 FL=1